MNKTKFISNGARKMFLLSAVVLLVPFVASAQGFVPLAGIPGLTEGVNTTASGLPAFFNNLYKYLIGLAAALAVIEIIWGGLQYSTQDSPGGKSGGKERIYQAIFGLVLVLSPVLVFSIINPSILNLSLNLPPLETKSSPPVQTESSKTLPTCSPFIKTDCIPKADTVNAVAAGTYDGPQPGGWCYQIRACGTSDCLATCGGICNYVCGSQTHCTATFKDDSTAIGSCKQY